MSTKKDLEAKDVTQIPRVIVGAFIFNDDGELFLMKSPKWNDKYVCPGGNVKFGESLTDAVKREVLEETNLKIKDIEFLAHGEATDLKDDYKSKNKHLVFLEFKGKASGKEKVKLNNEGSSYKWLKPSEWAKKSNVYKTTLNIIEKHLLDTESFESKYMRALADYQNLLKQTAKEKQDFVKYANEQLLMDLLPVYDNLKISLSHIDEAASQNGWAEGIKYVVKQFKDALLGIGVEEIETVGQKFDHHTMEAVEGEGEKVKKEIKPGYKLHGKLIVPAKVSLE